MSRPRSIPSLGRPVCLDGWAPSERPDPSRVADPAAATGESLGELISELVSESVSESVGKSPLGEPHSAHAIESPHLREARPVVDASRIASAEAILKAIRTPPSGATVPTAASRQPAIPERDEPAPEPRRPASPLAILVVESDPSVADFLSRTLSGLAYDVTVAASGSEALGQVRRRPPQWVFLSHQLRDMDALDLFGRVRRMVPAARGLLLAASTDVNLVFSAIESGIEHVLPKPLDPCDLLDLLAPAG